MTRYALQTAVLFGFAWATGTHAEAASMCAPGDIPVLSCPLVSSVKTASICARATTTPSPTRFYYAYGTTGASPEIVYPGPDASETLNHTHLMFGGNTGGYAFGFDNGGYSYAMYSISGSEGMHKAGLVVTRKDEDKPVKTATCRANAIRETDDMDLIRASSSLPENNSLQKRLPIH